VTLYAKYILVYLKCSCIIHIFYQNTIQHLEIEDEIIEHLSIHHLNIQHIQFFLWEEYNTGRW
jgi:hypothetical protein